MKLRFKLTCVGIITIVTTCILSLAIATYLSHHEPSMKGMITISIATIAVVLLTFKIIHDDYKATREDERIQSIRREMVQGFHEQSIKEKKHD